jgi:DNA adenine methylase
MKLQPPISLLGGKNRLKRRLVKMFPEHDTYAEPFLGAGHLLFYKKPAPKEYGCDINPLLVNLWKTIQDSELLEQFLDYLTCHPKSRAAFFEYRELLCDPDTYKFMSTVRLAAITYYLIKCSFGNMKLFTGHEGWNATVGTDKMAGFYSTKWDVMNDRLRNVEIRLQGFDTFIPDLNEVADDKTLLYADPPYMVTETHSYPYYSHPFTMKDHEHLSGLLHMFQGRFILSIDDRKEARALYKGFIINRLKLVYTVQNKHRGFGKQVGELVITNFELPNRQVQRELFEKE